MALSSTSPIDVPLARYAPRRGFDLLTLLARRRWESRRSGDGCQGASQPNRTLFADNGRARPFLIDTDTASDDAVALVLALRHPGVRVEAITVVAGNVPLEQAVQNALYTVELCGAETRVHAGCRMPLVRERPGSSPVLLLNCDRNGGRKQREYRTGRGRLLRWRLRLWQLTDQERSTPSPGLSRRMSA